MTGEMLHSAVTRAWAACEPGSAYDLDCFVTSEVGHNEVLSRCRRAEPGGAYVGVGPCQNFTYIGALRPSTAIIVDARMDNLLEHLIFKLVFERAATPAAYLATLFAREITCEVNTSSAGLLGAFDTAEAPAELFEANRQWIRAELRDRWRCPPRFIDRALWIYAQFHRRGLSITSVSEQHLARLDDIPDLRAVISSTAVSGHTYHFLTSQERYSYVRELQLHDQVIPVLGNITDAAAIATVNATLDRLGMLASTVYLSNMEEFLLHRYDIGPEGISSRPNPQGMLTDTWGAAYAGLVNSLTSIRADPECLLIRFFFSGEDQHFRYGDFPSLTGHIVLLRRFLGRYRTETPQSVFETYW